MPRQVYCVVRNPYQGIVPLLVPNLILFDDSIRFDSMRQREPEVRLSALQGV